MQNAIKDVCLSQNSALCVKRQREYNHVLIHDSAASNMDKFIQRCKDGLESPEGCYSLLSTRLRVLFFVEVQCLGCHMNHLDGEEQTKL